MVVKIKKIRKSKRKRGTTNYHGARKKHKSSGHKGGKGMSGTGKRADHKKSLIIKLYGNNYFGKQGITSRGTQKDKSDVINVSDIQENIDSLLKRFGKNGELFMEEYKILGQGEITIKVIIHARSVSASAKEKIENAKGTVHIKTVNKEEIVKEEPEKKPTVKKKVTPKN